MKLVSENTGSPSGLFRRDDDDGAAADAHAPSPQPFSLAEPLLAIWYWAVPQPEPQNGIRGADPQNPASVSVGAAVASDLSARKRQGVSNLLLCHAHLHEVPRGLSAFCPSLTPRPLSPLFWSARSLLVAPIVLLAKRKGPSLEQAPDAKDHLSNVHMSPPSRGWSMVAHTLFTTQG